MKDTVLRDHPDRQRKTLLRLAHEVLPILLVFAAALATYWNAQNYFFSEDDFSFLSRAKGLNPYPGLLAPLGSRLISTQIYFRLMHEIFNLSAGPYHWASLLLHALNAVLVYAVVRCWTSRRLPGLAAGLIFATFDLAFTAIFWISGVQDLLATMFMLITALIWVSRREKDLLVSALSAAAFACSLLSKETGILFLPVLLLLAWAQGAWGRRTWFALSPHAALSLGAVVLALAQSAKVPTGGAYETGFTSLIPHNFATYVMWTVDILHPFKDRVAEINHGAWVGATVVAIVVGLLLFTSRGRQAKMQWAALGWYVLIIAPVLPLVRHTFLYYIYPAAPGAAVLAGLVAYRFTRALSDRFGSRGGQVAWMLSFAAVAVICVMGSANVQSRESARLEQNPKLHQDHVLRSSFVSENAVTSFATLNIPEGADLILINPFEFLSEDLIKDKPVETRRRSYDLVSSALRDGEVLRLQRPDLGRVDFTYRMEPEWENRHALLYDGIGKLSYLGTGADMWVSMCSIHLDITKKLQESIRCGRRALEVDPNHAWADLFLGVALAKAGIKVDAQLHLERAVERAPTAAARDEAARALSGLGGEP